MENTFLSCWGIGGMQMVWDGYSGVGWRHINGMVVRY